MPGDQANLLAGVFGFSLWIAVKNKNGMLFQLQIRKRVNKGRSKRKDELLGSNISRFGQILNTHS